jgi:ATP-dependent DNA helicase RecG
MNCFPATQIDVVWFPEGAGGDKFTEKTFRGPIHRMLREALDFIQRNYITETVIKHPDRAEATRVVNFPYAAIEEALANAIYHRSYEEREPVEVRISAEELVVLSYPGPDRSVRLKQLRAGRALSRRYRNRRIGEFLKELDITEGRSTGIPKILDAMKRNGSPPPEFEFDDEHSYFMTRLPVHSEATRAVTEQVTEQVTGQVTGQVSPEIRRLLGVMRGEMIRQEIQKRLGLKGRANFEDRYLKPAIEAEFIELTIPDKPTSRLQKYRLSPKGATWLTSCHKSGGSQSASHPS